MSIQTRSIEPDYRTLPVKLTEEERLARALEAASKEHRFADAESEKSAVTKRLTEEMKTLRAEIRHLQRAVRTGTEYQPVQVVEHRNEERCAIEWIRLDTHEVIESRPMTVEERQVPLFGDSLRAKEADA